MGKHLNEYLYPVTKVVYCQKKENRSKQCTKKKKKKKGA